MPLPIGPAGTNTHGTWPADRAPISSPGTILSQIPNSSTASKTSWESAIAVLIAITSRLNRDSSMPGVTLGDPVAHGRCRPRDLGRWRPLRRASSRMIVG